MRWSGSEEPLRLFLHLFSGSGGSFDYRYISGSHARRIAGGNMDIPFRHVSGV